MPDYAPKLKSGATGVSHLVSVLRLVRPIACEQVGRKISAKTPALAHRIIQGMRTVIWGDDLAIEVPGRMAEHRHDDRQAKEAGREPDHQSSRYDHSPQRHRHWIGHH